MLRLLILFLAFTSTLFADPSGSLIVSYQTGAKGERLERVRFRVTGEKGYSELYPKGGTVISEGTNPCCIVAVDDLPPGTYTLEFIVPNQDAFFEEVPSREIAIAADQVTRIDQWIRPTIKLTKKSVPLAKVDETHFVGIYEVTNKQFARWLNKASEEKKIFIVDDAVRKGWIVDEAGRLLFKCREADPASQISLTTSQFFQVLSGKEHHPVVFVTWYGAEAYCKDHHYRLPSEAEWVHAAAQSKEEPRRVYLYGFGKDTISPAWANYKAESTPLTTLAVLTTKVGFYNGKNQLPTGESTMNAVSPFGAYDMSGNVWEWVKDSGENDQRMAKGGCYDSTADGVRVTERIFLPPEHCDQYTGFRVYYNP